MSDERYERGLKNFKEITGEVGEKFIQNLEEISTDFSRYLIEFPFGDIYNRPGLDVRTRELVTLSSLAAIGYAEPQIRAHIKVALNTGVTREEVLEVFIQTSVLLVKTSHILWSQCGSLSLSDACIQFDELI